MPRKQEDLPSVEGPGVAPKRIKAIEAAADEYVQARDSRMTMLTEEVRRRDSLVALMQKHGVTIYQFDDEKIELISGKLKVKVRKINEGEDGESPYEND